ncbi:MAG: B12-binding domain-containing radical SAM protein [Ardenticatenales bacterium]|nr:B12-binding domain-containing radical SAM protein [Ardenticatenales bacterium]MCB9172952.1 B12-binding domain-containing radical SAM protein [Ardenticatenales bacterium]
MNLVLYNPPSSANRKPILPMSLLALGALLEGRHDYRIVDGNLEADAFAAVEQTLDEIGATTLAVTVMPGPQLHDAVPFCRELKRRRPEMTVVWGGYFPTQHWDVCLRADYVDYVVLGHGEQVFIELLEALDKGGDPRAIFGLAYRNRAGEPTANPHAPIPKPEALPDWPYHRIDVARYIRRTFMGTRTLPHHSSYGCPFYCNFCAVVNMVNGRWYAQSAERTARITRQLVDEWGVDAVEFYDNNFFTHEARTAEFAERILDLGIGWWGEARIDTMLKYSERTWRMMADSGLRMVFLGAESGSDETLQRMNKGGKASTEKTLEIAAKMRDYGIVPEMSFVMGNPPDPEADVMQTIEFIRKVKRVNPETEMILYMYTPVPLAGELYDQAKADGFAFPETLEAWIGTEWQEFAQRRSTTMPWVKDPLRRHVRDFERVLNAYYPTSTDISLTALHRGLLRGISAWRYRSGFYRNPLELRALHKVLAYQRPETSGF